VTAHERLLHCNKNNYISNNLQKPFQHWEMFLSTKSAC